MPKSKTSLLHLGILACILGASYMILSSQRSQLILSSDPSVSSFSWSDLNSAKNITWRNCEDERFECAKINVPLNYSEPEGQTASIALKRWPAAVSRHSDLYRGPILFNPGGPGGSGVAFITRLGLALSIVLGPHYDLVGFDPRGVGQSVPAVSFYNTSTQRLLWHSSILYPINVFSDGVARAFAHAQLTNQLAAETDRNVLQHINTENTARDMLRITEAHGKEKLQYWGFSYGSVLGSTFASILPDKVERLIIDGVVDQDDYYRAGWTENLPDTQKDWQTFFDACSAAGPSSCAFYEPTPSAISARFQAVSDSIARRPVPVRTPISYGLVDAARLRTSIFLALYSPFAVFPTLAKALASLEKGDGTLLWQLLEAPPFECGCDSGADPFPPIEAQTAILCNDGGPVPNTLEAAEKHVKELAKKSPWYDVWAQIRISCSGWPKLPRTHFQGPVGAANTSFPLLVIGNTADPVTPLRSANATAFKFPGSALLTQDSPGHCSLAAPSSCTLQHIRAYFHNGTIPKAGIVCPMDAPLFSDAVVGAEASQTLHEQTVFKWQNDVDSGLHGPERELAIRDAKAISQIFASMRSRLPLGV